MKFDENGRQFSKRVENTVGKRRNCSLRAISSFPDVFSKDLYYRHVKTRACLGKDKQDIFILNLHTMEKNKSRSVSTNHFYKIPSLILFRIVYKFDSNTSIWSSQSENQFFRYRNS